MRTALLTIYLGMHVLSCFSQANEWTWVNGDSTVNNNSVYGIKGITAQGNKPSSRWLSISWTDKTGNLWLYGGSSDASLGSYHLNDLWEYNIAGNEWRWVSGDTIKSINGIQGIYGTKGVAAPGNKPGGKSEAVSWTDNNENLWLFGGGGPDASLNNGLLNDLWEYNITGNEWTWVSGDSVVNKKGIYGTKGVSSGGNPGSRTQGVTWTDSSNNLWMFGGAGYDALESYGELDDLWMFNIASSQWMWVGGDTVVSVNSVYGAKGVAAPQNKPGGRVEGVSWKDNEGNLWLFGGYGYPAKGAPLELNDLWEYSIANNEWTWISGDTVYAVYGHYGTRGAPNPENKPGSARWSVSWADYSDNLWMFGGYGYGGGTNALWKFNIGIGQWTWMTGDTIGGIYGTYGTKGIPDTANTPGTRQASISWTDTSGNLWLFGGDGFPASTVNGNMDDLWRFNPGNTIQSPVAQFSASIHTICAGESITFTDSSTGSPDSRYWTFTGGTPDTSAAQNPVVTYNIPGLYKVKLVVSNSAGTDSLTKTAYITVNTLPVPLVSSPDSLICSGDSTQVCTTDTFVYYLWNTGNTSFCATVKAAGGYWVTVTDANHCSAVSGHREISVYPVPSVSITVQGDTLSSFGAISYQWYLNGDSIPNANGPVYVARESGNYSVGITDTNGCKALSNSSYITITGVTQFEEGGLLTIYPDPFTNSIFIKEEDASQIVQEVNIYDVLGRVALTKEYKNYPGGLQSLEVTGLPAGIYCIEVKTSQLKLTKSIIKY